MWRQIVRSRTERSRPMKALRDRDDTEIEPLLIPAKQAVRMLGISQRHLYTLVKRGEIKVKRIGRKVMFRKTDIEGFVLDLD